MDNTTAVAEDIGRQLLVYGRRLSFQEIEMRLAAISVEEIKRVARRYLHSRELALTALGPIDNLPTFERIKALNSMQVDEGCQRY